jgi:hypothetical protein
MAAFEVDLRALDSFGERAEENARRFDALARALTEHHIGANSLGRLPESTEAFQRYTERVHAGVADLGAAHDLLRSVAASIREVRSVYRDADDAVEEDIESSRGEL